MVAHRILMGRMGLLVLGGVFLLGVQLVWGDDALSSEGALRPVPAPASAVVPGDAGTQPTTPDAGGQQPANASVLESSPAPCDEGGTQFCGTTLCSPPGRFWVRADYLIWWTNGMRLPPLVTTSPSGTDVSEAGVLGYANTSILYGNSTIGDNGRSGFRTTLGMWLDNCQNLGVEFDYLSLGQEVNGYSATSNGSTILARPFYNLQTNAQASELVAYPNVVQGTVSVDAKDYFQSIGATLSYNLCCCNSCCDPCGDACGDSCGGGCGGNDPCADACCPPMTFGCRTDLLLGMRYYNLSDSLGVTEDLAVTEEGATNGTTYLIHDNFRARNDFYGSEIGLRTRLYRGRWSMEILTKIALGNNHQTVTINGDTTITPLGKSSQTYSAGILAGDTNSGVYQRDTFTMIPQLGLELGYQITCNWRAFVGYNILYWGCVARSADQIDLNLDPRNFPPATEGGLPYPAYPGKTSCFWAQGVNVGTEFRY